MNKLRYALTLAIVVILQNTVLSRVQFFGAQLHLSLVFIVCLSVLFDSKRGGYTGLGIGLVEDLVFETVLGVRALSYFIVGYAIGESMKNTATNRTLGIFATIAATLFHTVFYLIVQILLGKQVVTFQYFRGPIFIECLLNGLLYLAMLEFLKRFLKPQNVKRYSGY